MVLPEIAVTILGFGDTGEALLLRAILDNPGATLLLYWPENSFFACPA